MSDLQSLRQELDCLIRWRNETVANHRHRIAESQATINKVNREFDQKVLPLQQEIMRLTSKPKPEQVKREREARLVSLPEPSPNWDEATKEWFLQLQREYHGLTNSPA